MMDCHCRTLDSGEAPVIRYADADGKEHKVYPSEFCLVAATERRVVTKLRRRVEEALAAAKRPGAWPIILLRMCVEAPSKDWVIVASVHVILEDNHVLISPTRGGYFRGWEDMRERHELVKAQHAWRVKEWRKKLTDDVRYAMQALQKFNEENPCKVKK